MTTVVAGSQSAVSRADLYRLRKNAEHELRAVRRILRAMPEDQPHQRELRHLAWVLRLELDDLENELAGGYR